VIPPQPNAPDESICVAGASSFLGYWPTRIAASQGAMTVEHAPPKSWRRACLAHREMHSLSLELRELIIGAYHIGKRDGAAAR